MLLRNASRKTVPFDDSDQPFEKEITDVLDLHLIPPRDVKGVIQEYLYQCHQKGFRFIRIIHGKGIGFQKNVVRDLLAKSEWVDSFEDGPDWGSTAITLKS
jgi:DNA-nicking Smr family endonuclease